MNVEPQDSQPAPMGTSRSRAFRFYAAVAWSNVGILTKEQVIVALSRMGVAAIPTPACHPNCLG